VKLFRANSSPDRKINCHGFVCSTHRTISNSCWSDLYKHLMGYKAHTAR